MEPSLAARRATPLEVLDDIGDVHLVTHDAGRLQRLVQDPSGGTDEWLALSVLYVAGLLPDDQQPSAFAAGPEDGLGRVSPQVAGLAACRGGAEGLERAGLGDDPLTFLGVEPVLRLRNATSLSAPRILTRWA
jgi:hypothetical protein